MGHLVSDLMDLVLWWRQGGETGSKQDIRNRQYVRWWLSAKEKSKRGWVRAWGWGGVAVLGGVDEKDLIKQVTFA